MPLCPCHAASELTGGERRGLAWGCIGRWLDKKILSKAFQEVMIDALKMDARTLLDKVPSAHEVDMD